MGKLTGKGKHKVVVGNHPHTTISKSATMRRGEYKCRKWELHVKLRDQKLKTKQNKTKTTLVLVQIPKLFFSEKNHSIVVKSMSFGIHQGIDLSLASQQGSECLHLTFLSLSFLK